MGVLTQFLMEDYPSVHAIEIDRESVAYLKESLVKLGLILTEGDFLRIDVNELAKGKQLFVVGNFPYNISSQIVFKVLEAVPSVKGFGGMFQTRLLRLNQVLSDASGKKVLFCLAIRNCSLK